MRNRVPTAPRTHHNALQPRARAARAKARKHALANGRVEEQCGAFGDGAIHAEARDPAFGGFRRQHTIGDATTVPLGFSGGGACSYLPSERTIRAGCVWAWIDPAGDGGASYHDSARDIGDNPSCACGAFEEATARRSLHAAGESIICSTMSYGGSVGWFAFNQTRGPMSWDEREHDQPQNLYHPSDLPETEQAEHSIEHSIEQS